jgi:hypothetical protein
MLALLLSGVASASPAVDYIDSQMRLDYQMEALYVRYTVDAVRAGTGGGDSLALAQSQAREFLETAQSLEPWPGDDGGLNQALVLRAEHCVLFFEQTLPTMVGLIGGAHPRDADQLQFETLLNLSEVTDVQDMERLNASLHAFGDANRVRITDEPPDLVDPPVLEVELPGPASGLSSAVRVSFAIAHHNEMVLYNDEVLAVWNDLVVSESSTVQGQRGGLEQAVQELKEVPPWMGDDTLTTAMSANGEALLGLVDLLIQSAELDMRVFLFGKKRRQRDGLLEEVEYTVPTLNAAVRAAQRSFMESWHVDAYEQHNKDLVEWAASQRGGR